MNYSFTSYIDSIIAESERVLLGEGTLSTVMRVSGGDMRKAVTYLQSSHQLTGAGMVVTPECVMDISGQVPPDVLHALWTSFQTPTNPFDAVQRCVNDVMCEGYPMTDLLLRLHEDVLVSTVLKDIDKALICEKLAQVGAAYF